jgi:hypothetical protein
LTAGVVLAAGCGGGPSHGTTTFSSGQACGQEGVAHVAQVRDARGLTRALAEARPGWAVVVTPGTYQGHFQATRAGARRSPILLCGAPGSVLAGGARGYTLHLDRADWWVVSHLTVSGGAKGVVLDATNHTTLTDLHVTGTGEEAVHLRQASSHDTLSRLRIDHTGSTSPKFGEGVYVGSAEENWCRYTACEPDASDDDSVLDSVFGPDIAAENVDIKEGTTGGLVARNSFSGVGTTEADSWVDVKGNRWLIRDNTGSAAPRDGVQVHVRRPGWGENNVISGNVFSIPAGGYGVRVQSDAIGTVVACSNKVTGAGSRSSNVECV